MCLQKLFKQQAEADNPLVVRVDAGQSMAVTNVECSKCEVKSHGRVVEIAKRNCEHADAVERNNPTWRQLVLLQFCRRREIAFYQFSNFTVAREAQHDLVDDVLEHKVLVVVRRGQLNVFEHQFVDYEVCAEHISFQVLPHVVMLKRKSLAQRILIEKLSYVIFEFTSEHNGPQPASNGCRREAFLEDLLTQRSMFR